VTKVLLALALFVGFASFTFVGVRWPAEAFVGVLCFSLALLCWGVAGDLLR
jgi:hypothetical protein